eukprot:CAMPEP_0170226304 /NCGR_PEP_ID=MMETSP0116_2-20130129/12863_1 /TAXON_ID=400756 /ORGANISM="Durinskia baltica, Strain CSIRO CS-38" /LENGTH=363 /DNA_ID=CAMNT_0010477029 /DNA_START=448 /DNA_END=1537 /DNA_ORIENTATION=+
MARLAAEFAESTRAAITSRPAATPSHGERAVRAETAVPLKRTSTVSQRRGTLRHDLDEGILHNPREASGRLLSRVVSRVGRRKARLRTSDAIEWRPGADEAAVVHVSHIGIGILPRQAAHRLADCTILVLGAAAAAGDAGRAWRLCACLVRAFTGFPALEASPSRLAQAAVADAAEPAPSRQQQHPDVSREGCPPPTSRPLGTDWRPEDGDDRHRRPAPLAAGHCEDEAVDAVRILASVPEGAGGARDVVQAELGAEEVRLWTQLRLAMRECASLPARARPRRKVLAHPRLVQEAAILSHCWHHPLSTLRMESDRVKDAYSPRGRLRPFGLRPPDVAEPREAHRRRSGGETSRTGGGQGCRVV